MHNGEQPTVPPPAPSESEPQCCFERPVAGDASGAAPASAASAQSLVDSTRQSVIGRNGGDA